MTTKKLSDLRIDPSRRRDNGGAKRKGLLVVGLLAVVVFGLLAMRGPSAITVETHRVQAPATASSGERVVLNAAGYIVAHHKIEVAAKVMGRVAWIGVEKGDRVREGQVVVRLEDDEFRARVQESEGRLAALQARLAELEAGSRPEEIQLAEANLEEARAEARRAELDFERSRELFEAGVIAKQQFDEAAARGRASASRVHSLDRALELVRIGPREEQIDAMRGEVAEIEGRLEYAKTQLEGTVIRAPVTGTILERNVEIGEFVTTSFVGERGAKGYVVSLADLNDLQVELDISQQDFAKLRPDHKAIVTTDAYRDREYEGKIAEISPEADRQKATVQVKVQVLKPDDYLRPEMNANVAFTASGEQAAEKAEASGGVLIPPSALRGGDTVFLLVGEQAVERKVETRRTTREGVEIESGLSGGEDVILAPPEDLADGARVVRKEG